MSASYLTTYLGCVLVISITVYVPDHRVEEFYVRFGEFISDTPNPEAPVRLKSGVIPRWAESDDAASIAAALWGEISLPGHSVLLHMIRGTDENTTYFRPEEIADALNHPKGKSGIAGILGGVGKAIRRAGLPMYSTSSGGTWHYIWNWDGDRYSMTPEVARLLRKASIGPSR
jgi:hypothetical protein